MGIGTSMLIKLNVWFDVFRVHGIDFNIGRSLFCLFDLFFMYTMNTRGPVVQSIVSLTKS